MAGQHGIDFVLKVNTGTVGSPVYTTVGSQRGASLNISQSTADVTTKDDAGWENNLPNMRSWSVDCDALWIESDTAYARIEAMILSGQAQYQVQILTQGANTYTGLVTATSLGLDMPYDAEATISCSFQGAGALTKA